MTEQLPTPEAASHDDLEKIVGFAAELADALGEILEDGKLSFMDFKALNMASEAMHGLLSVDKTKLMPEAKDLLTDKALVVKLGDLFMEKFSIPEQHVEAMVQKFLPLAIESYGTMLRQVAILKEFKALIAG
jgi:hypothetical protein